MACDGSRYDTVHEFRLCFANGSKVLDRSKLKVSLAGNNLDFIPLGQL
jgi:hypothetical protein